MTTCAEWAAELDVLRTAERTYLTGGVVTTIQAGEKRITKSDMHYPSLQARIRYVQAKVDICNGETRRPGRAIVFTPSDC